MTNRGLNKHDTRTQQTVHNKTTLKQKTNNTKLQRIDTSRSRWGYPMSSLERDKGNQTKEPRTTKQISN